MNKICLQCKMEFTQTKLNKDFCNYVCKKIYRNKDFIKYFHKEPDNSLVPIREK